MCSNTAHRRRVRTGVGCRVQHLINRVLRESTRLPEISFKFSIFTVRNVVAAR